MKTTYFLTREIVLRSTAFIYLIAFLIAFNQNPGLIGNDSLLPIKSYMSNIEKQVPDLFERIKQFPTIFWLIGNDDYHLNLLSVVGIIISGVILIGLSSNFILFLILWILYHSIVNVGQNWYSFGWESQLLETGFLAIFLAPWISLSTFAKNQKPTYIILWLFLWLEFRIMLGAGMIKLRGDQCWKDLTCMFYHYETQPNPLPTAYYMHKFPEFLHKFEVLGNHAVELGFCWLIIMPFRMCRIVGGFFLINFQIILISSGNLSFLNWLTLVPCLAAFDDQFYLNFVPIKLVDKFNLFINSRKDYKFNKFSEFLRIALSLCFFSLILYLSKPVLENIVSKNQIMNTSFDSLRLVNTYGAFGSVGQKRYEVIIEITHKEFPEQDNDWKEIVFKCKPGPINRRPCIITPYHYRLDWVIWFAGFEPHDFRYHPWILHLMGKLLVGDQKTLDLLDSSNSLFYFPKGKNSDIAIPTYVRAILYEYKFNNPNEKIQKGWNQGTWWNRRRKKEYIMKINLESHLLIEAFKQMGWKLPEIQKNKKNKKKSDL